ncbi:MAG: GNAT family N-acetyltransferase [Nocardioides sp.]|nr:GNAT family N-acetyltransferase [Nocardioides sp.]
MLFPSAGAHTGSPDVRCASLAALDAATAYAIWRLRSEVFVVEQDCVYLDLDGRDAEPTTLHWWVPGGSPGQVAAYLRVLATDEPGEARIGRVVTAPLRRGEGLAGALVAASVADLVARGATRVTIDAQSHLEGWYGGFGFRRTGAEFLEDGIPHVPMAHEA